MVVKFCSSFLHLTQPSVPHPPQTVSSTLSSPSLKSRSTFSEGALVFKHRVHYTNRRSNPVRRSCSADSSYFSDEEFAKQMQELAMRFQTPHGLTESESESSSDSDSVNKAVSGDQRIFDRLERQDWMLEQADMPLERPIQSDWPLERPNNIPSGIEWKASKVDLPLSLRMIKRKRQWQEGFRETGESACCSVKKAFSSMVFIIRELQCFAIQTRETIMYEDLKGILSRVQKEMHASFVWLFQQIFSSTPTLMVYVMILLANYSVYSMTAIAAPLPPPTVMETISILENQNNNRFDPFSVRTFSVSSNSGKTESVGGNDGGGGNFRPVSSGTDGGGEFRSEWTIVPDGVREESVSVSESLSGRKIIGEEEARLWNSIVNEATKMQSELKDEALDHEAMRRFVSPVSAKLESDDYTDYFRTELFYQMGLSQDPINPLLLVNYAQFLYLVARDYNRAEEYFKRAVKVKPPDAEALSKYASFLWQAKKDLWGAEENYLDAISADPSNSYYAANYAHFLWSTGGEDTCFPIDAPNTNAEDC